MIEPDIEKDLERIIEMTGSRGMVISPLRLPARHLEGVIYQRISDPKIFTGLAKTKLVQARFQVTVQSEDYPTALALSDAIRDEWESIEQGYIGDYPVQAVVRGNFLQSMEEQTGGRTIWRLTRDFILIYAEDAK
ncbi:hypothetical protein [Arsenophonus nasoniae]|uniref:Phage protein n=1 Tax=Arsenophonus nasoniae TaxID=638 RepID=A0AA95K8P3_9GAMM|nr:hypothetical protein [Arsenophonus nasoniae]WGL96543.1 hypothetical protein QE207_08405 [Arsenophonus nasoniae]